MEINYEIGDCIIIKDRRFIILDINRKENSSTGKEEAFVSHIHDKWGEKGRWINTIALPIPIPDARLDIRYDIGR